MAEKGKSAGVDEQESFDLEDSERFDVNATEQQPRGEERVLSNIDEYIHPADVLCGRVKESFNHGGNKRYRETITSYLEDFSKARNKFEKQIVIHNILESVRTNGGRFLKQNKVTCRWEVLSDSEAKGKVGHAIRDAVSTFESRQQLNLAKLRKNRPIMQRTSSEIIDDDDHDSLLDVQPFTSVPQSQFGFQSHSAVQPRSASMYGPSFGRQNIYQSNHPGSDFSQNLGITSMGTSLNQTPTGPYASTSHYAASIPRAGFSSFNQNLPAGRRASFALATLDPSQVSGSVPVPFRGNHPLATRRLSALSTARDNPLHYQYSGNQTRPAQTQRFQTSYTNTFDQQYLPNEEIGYRQRIRQQPYYVTHQMGNHFIQQPDTFTRREEQSNLSLNDLQYFQSSHSNDAENDNDQNFLATIDDVLGPMPDDSDLLEPDEPRRFFEKDNTSP